MTRQDVGFVDGLALTGGEPEGDGEAAFFQQDAGMRGGGGLDERQVKPLGDHGIGIDDRLDDMAGVGAGAKGGKVGSKYIAMTIHLVAGGASGGSTLVEESGAALRVGRGHQGQYFGELNRFGGRGERQGFENDEIVAVAWWFIGGRVATEGDEAGGKIACVQLAVPVVGLDFRAAVPPVGEPWWEGADAGVVGDVDPGG